MNRQDYDREQESRDALASKLRNYADGPWYPMHMPGHKRRLSSVPGLPVSLDFTEVPGTDDLHHPESILKAAMERTARTVGADRTWYLVNGSTAGNLAAVFALAPYHGELIVAGNCHRSVYHGLELRDVHPHFIDPVMDPEYGIPTVIRPEDVEEAFRKYPESSGVILTSPTYEGVVSDIRSIAEICHRHGGLLFVDEAHGAHFGLVEEADFPESAIRCGADLSVQSAHKTLLGLTQTAFLHCRGKRIDQEAIQRALDMFESSSPSYPLLMSLDGCTDWLLREGKKCFCAWRDHLHALDQTLRELKYFKVLCHGGEREEVPDARRRAALRHGFYDYDPSKLLIHTGNTPYTGEDLSRILADRFHFVLEMSLSDNALAMTGPGDDPEALRRFGEALLVLDRELDTVPASEKGTRCLKNPLKREREQVMTLQAAAGQEREMIPFSKAVGHVSCESVFCYPPGIPILVPGERISEEAVWELQRYRAEERELRFSVSPEKDDTIACVREVW